MATLPILRAADAAEARGDAGGALDVIERDLQVRGDMHFWRPWRIERLVLIETLGPLLPGWAVSRWLLAQAAHCLDRSMTDRVRRALEVAIDARGGMDALGGVDELDARSKVIDHDWIFRQTLLFELGAAEHFVRRIAAPDLVRRADRIEEWIRTPMSGYRLVREEPRWLTWVDLATGREVRCLNIGPATFVEPGECVIGRLVPIEAGALFESAPLLVPPEVAQRVADDPSDWMAALSGAEGLRTDAVDDRLLSDVPHVVQLVVATRASAHGGFRQAQPADGARPTANGSTEDAVRRLVGLVRAALDGRLVEGEHEFTPFPSVAAALHEPLVLRELVARLRPEDAPKLLGLAELLPEPSDEICRSLASDVTRAA